MVSKLNGKAFMAFGWVMSIVITVLLTLLTVAAAKSGFEQEVKGHIGRVEVHEPELRKQRRINDTIDARLAPIELELQHIKKQLDRIEEKLD